MSVMKDSSLKYGCGTSTSVVSWGAGAKDDAMSGYVMESAFFPFRRLLGSTTQ